MFYVGGVQLMALLREVTHILNNQDIVGWPYGGINLFTMKLCYENLMQGQVEEFPNLDFKQVMKDVWVTKVPPKVKIFSWRLIQGRLPTRWKLARKGIITSPP